MKARHTLISGDSGGGKTTLAREIADTSGFVSVWVGEGDRIPGQVVNGPQTLREAVDGGASVVHYKTGDVLTAVTHARSLAYHETRRPVSVIVDEAQDHLREDQSNPIKAGLHRDRDVGVRYVLITQDPSDLPYTPLKQVRYWAWVGEWSTFHDGFLRYFSVPREELPDERFRYVVLDKRMAPLYRDETREKYA